MTEDPNPFALPREPWDRFPLEDGGPDTTAEQGSGSPARLELVDPTSFQGRAVPDRRWLVQNWIPWGVVAGIYGDGGLGKTLLAQQLQTATAIDQPWLGLETTAVRSIGVYCEDDKDELWRRQDAIDRLYGCDFHSLSNARWLPRLGHDNVLMNFSTRGVGSLTPFYRELLETTLDFGARLVVIDTVADTYGGNENDRSQVRQYVSVALGGIARRIDGAVVACAHPSRAGITSGDGDGGSTGWSNTFRSRLFLHAPKAEDGEAADPDARVLARKKANYAARNDEIPLRWHEGAFVLNRGTDGPSMFRAPADDVFLQILAAMTAEQRPVTDTVNAGNYAPRVFGRRPDRHGYRKPEFAAAMERLFAQGRIAMVEYGRKSDLRRKIVAIEAAREGD